jgi:hypothetical protein
MDKSAIIAMKVMLYRAYLSHSAEELETLPIAELELMHRLSMDADIQAILQKGLDKMDEEAKGKKSKKGKKK